MRARAQSAEYRLHSKTDVRHRTLAAKQVNLVQRRVVTMVAWLRLHLDLEGIEVATPIFSTLLKILDILASAPTTTTAIWRR